ncbi:MAG: VanZ family protein [Acidimicrobiia bacterium]|nr:VanZ family protein [Acidimicrobiia bacterium]
MIWRRRGGDTAREFVIAGLFIWSLVVVYFTFFPMTIIFYAWYGRFNLVPFASILQLIRETSKGLASYNIGGNLLLLAPLGVFLPLLFKTLQRPFPLLWRVAVISTSIEVTQLFTRARAVDIDDVILNTTGVALAYLLYKALVRVADTTQPGHRLLDRLAAEPTTEPLLQPAVPVVVTGTIAAALMLSAIAGATLSEGAGGIVAYALADSPGSTVVNRVDVEDYALVMVRSPDPDVEQLSLYGYKKVLPGRYTWVMGPASVRFAGSGYSSGITAFNPTVGEAPTI